MRAIGMWIAVGLLLTIGSGRAFPQTGEVPEETSAVTASPGSGPSVHLSKEMNQKPEHASTRIVTENYIIGTEDVLEISVWRNQDLSKEVI